MCPLRCFSLDVESFVSCFRVLVIDRFVLCDLENRTVLIIVSVLFNKDSDLFFCCRLKREI